MRCPGRIVRRKEMSAIDKMNYEINTQSWGTEKEVGGKKMSRII
jgi:hypothetical protein